jgi:hypothetical protein
MWSVTWKDGDSKRNAKFKSRNINCSNFTRSFSTDAHFINIFNDLRVFLLIKRDPRRSEDNCGAGKERENLKCVLEKEKY